MSDHGSQSGQTVGSRDRKKRQTREAIEAAGWRLFIRQGYDETTIDDIAAAADVAPRTFFRHFETKEAVLFGDWRVDLDKFAMRLRDRPMTESPLASLAAVMVSFAARFEADGPMHVQRHRVVSKSRTVSDYQREVILPTWQDEMSTVLAERLNVDPDHDLRPVLFAGVAIAALNAASSLWMARGGVGSLTDVFRQAFAELGVEPAVIDAQTGDEISRP